MTTPGSVLVVGNRIDPDAGYVGERFVERGLRLVRAWREDALPSEVPAGTAVLLLLGSEWSVAHPVAPDVLEAECALVRSAAETGVPVLGLCYGAQVLAHAYGGLVRTASTPEIGLVAVDSVDEGVVPPGPWWAFHSDVIEAPPGARLVARNGCGVQAFTLPGALGVQFHPEVRPSVLEEWLARVPAIAAASELPAPELVALAKRREEESRAAAGVLVDDFLARFAAGRGPTEAV